MIVINTTATSFNYISRGYNPDSMVITNEATNVSTTLSIALVDIYDHDYYVQISNINYNFTEGNYYRIVLKDGNGDDVYRDRIFCTDQSAEIYSPNKYTYKSFETQDNDFLMY